LLWNHFVYTPFRLLDGACGVAEGDIVALHLFNDALSFSLLEKSREISDYSGMYSLNRSVATNDSPLKLLRWADLSQVMIEKSTTGLAVALINGMVTTNIELSPKVQEIFRLALPLGVIEEKEWAMKVINAKKIHEAGPYQRNLKEYGVSWVRKHLSVALSLTPFTDVQHREMRNASEGILLLSKYSGDGSSGSSDDSYMDWMTAQTVLKFLCTCEIDFESLSLLSKLLAEPILELLRGEVLKSFCVFFVCLPIIFLLSYLDCLKLKISYDYTKIDELAMLIK
jgi:hypothetical protein